METLEQSISFDDMMDALADVQRRKLLIALLEQKPQDSKPAVLAHSEGESDAVKGLVVSMQHNHLPKLADYGFIEWNKHQQEVLKGPEFDEIRPLLKLLDNHTNELPADWV